VVRPVAVSTAATCSSELSCKVLLLLLFSVVVCHLQMSALCGTLQQFESSNMQICLVITKAVSRGFCNYLSAIGFRWLSVLGCTIFSRTVCMLDSLVVT